MITRSVLSACCCCFSETQHLCVEFRSSHSLTQQMMTCFGLQTSLDWVEWRRRRRKRNETRGGREEETKSFLTSLQTSTKSIRQRRRKHLTRVLLNNTGLNLTLAIDRLQWFNKRPPFSLRTGRWLLIGTVCNLMLPGKRLAFSWCIITLLLLLSSNPI